MRLPQEDFCQALNVPSARKYESQGGPGISQIMDYLRGSDHAARDRYHFMKAQVVFWLLADLVGSVQPAEKENKREPRPAKCQYTDAEGNTQTWTGQTVPIREGIAAGKTLNDFLI